MKQADRASRSNFIDPEVVQRLLKALDFSVLFAAALVLYARLSVGNAEDAALTGFLALSIALACVLANRSAGLYRTRRLVESSSSSVTAIACAASIGAAVS